MSGPINQPTLVVEFRWWFMPLLLVLDRVGLLNRLPTCVGEWFCSHGSVLYLDQQKPTDSHANISPDGMKS